MEESSSSSHWMEVSGQFQTPAALPPGKEPQYPLDRGPSGPQSRSGPGDKEKRIPSPSLPEIELRLVRSLVAML
jgi:hypothetical protein